MSSAPRRSFGRVRKLPSGRWQARYPGPDGRDRTAPDTFATKTDANRYLAAVEVDQARGTWLDPARGAVTLRAYADAWLATRTVRGRALRPRTASNYRGLLDRHVYPHLGGLPLSAVTPERIRLWHAQVGAAGATTAAQAYRMLHAVLETATVEGPSPATPASSAVLRSPRRRSARSSRTRTSRRWPRRCLGTCGHSSCSRSGLVCAWASCWASSVATSSWTATPGRAPCGCSGSSRRSMGSPSLGRRRRKACGS